MMKTLLAVLAVAALAGACRKKVPQVEEPKAAQAEAKVDNAATRYVSSMQSSVEKAQAAADKANATIKQRTPEEGQQ